MAAGNYRSQMMKSVQSCALLVLTLCAFAIIAAEPDASPTGSVNDVMMAVITPATNKIWGIEDPQTDEEWQVFIDAAAEIAGRPFPSITMVH